MSGRLSEEIEVKVPASEAWKLFGTLKLADIVLEALSNVFSKIDIVEGDGGAGTILHLFFTPGMPGLSSYKEKFVALDNEKREKVVEVVEGWYLDMGFKSYRVRFEVIDKGNECCNTRATIEYEVKEEANVDAAALVSIQPMVAILNVAAKHLLQTTTAATAAAE
ncbi:s-norcoclaurine synthase [Phtheirospermum japonicum]|uniref:S-norcoclaurine synthase n=1 Tax=Phtheirospermum japonicum TaxID=374723 RepID=A0A830CQL1_9LAMI|nr:s-norcoclaurine synthase [Phtheirospermum japonicum]